MKVSLNWVKRYIDIPENITNEQLAYDLTMRTVEVESVINTADKFHDIVVGVIKEVQPHPNADKLRVCMVDCGENELKQIVCGGSNLYPGEKVVVSKPGAEVYWHGEAELQKIKETKMRGVASYGMICGASEVYLDYMFPTDDERVIVDLGDIECYPGQNVAEICGMVDTVLEIDNKSLTNRPDLWGHYGIARELSAIYKIPLKPMVKAEIPEGLSDYDVTIEAPNKCYRYDALEIKGVDSATESPMWMKALILNAGMRPINAIVDITNFVMLAVGQPTHAFDQTHVDGRKIVVREAKKGEQLELLDGAMLDLTETDLVICDETSPMGLAGIRGGKKDSILPETTEVLLEVANFSASTIRQTGKRFDEKTDSSIRYEKGIDTQRVDQGLAVSMQLFRELFPNCEFTAYHTESVKETEPAQIDVAKSFLDVRLGKEIPIEEIEQILTHLGFEVDFDGEVFHVTAPSWRSTGDIALHDDVLGEIARILGYESFEAKPLPVNFYHAVRQPKESLLRHLREYLAFRCGFYEIFTYPWIDEKYIQAAGIDTTDAVRLATPPAPELAIVRQSLVPGALEAVMKNLRYFDEFRIFEMAQCFSNEGEYHPNTEDETLPIHRMLLTGAAAGKDAADIFFTMKGVLESMASYCHMEDFTFKQVEKPTWADEHVYLNLVDAKKQVIGSLGLVSVATLNEVGIKRTQVAVFEINTELLVPLPSRTNEFVHLPMFPIVEEDLSILVDESVTWEEIHDSIKNMVKEVLYIDTYRGKQVPEGKKSVTLRVRMGNDDSTMTSKQIEKKMKGILKNLQNKVHAVLREE